MGLTDAITDKWAQWRGGPVIPVVRMRGVISAQKKPGRINIETYAPVLERAFKRKSAPAIAIVINSPGGSAVQSRLVSKRIRELADEHGKKVLVFVEDAAASGGYFIAVAGDEIYADPSSIVGSIGVIYAGFGFEEAIGKIGVKRRLYTAGNNKSTLDPFLPEKPQDVKRIKSFEQDIHKVFIDHVKAHRGDRLKGEDAKLFTGEWWTGVRALEMGLIDGLGDVHALLRQRYGKTVQLKQYAPKRGMLQLPSIGLDAGRMAGEAIDAIEERAIWARIGL